MALDIQYGATQAEKEFVKNTLDSEGVKALFDKELNNLSTKIVRNFHNDNYLAFEVNKTFDTEKQSMKDIINKDSDMKAKYEAALAKNKTRGGFSEGVLLLQAIAIKCITILTSGEEIEKKLTSWNEVAYKSQAMDGILGPNTFYVLASIAKEKGISFNGVVDTTLLSAMISICGEEPAADDNIPVIENNAPVIENSTPVIENSAPVINNENITVIENTTPIIENNIPVVENNNETVASDIDDIIAAIDNTDVQTINTAIENLQQKNIDPNTNPDEYKKRMQEISDLQKQKDALLTPEQIQEEIKKNQDEINLLQPTITKENEFEVNSKINFHQSNITQLQKLLDEKLQKTQPNNTQPQEIVL